MRLNRYAVAALAGAAAMFVGGAAALADGGGKKGARCDQLLAKIAATRGVSVDQLKADVQARLLARIDAAEKAGKVSPERAAALRQRVASGSLCLAGKRALGHRAAHSMLRAAAEFLGLDREQLEAQLPGTSLAALAAKQGKSVDALEAAMVAPAKARLAKAVADGKLTQAQADSALTRLQELAARLATRVFPAT